jgi:hypothetical protein
MLCPVVVMPGTSQGIIGHCRQATYTPIQVAIVAAQPVLSLVLNAPHGLSRIGGILGFSPEARRLEAPVDNMAE